MVKTCQVNRAIVLSRLLCGVERWSILKKHVRTYDACDADAAPQIDHGHQVARPSEKC